MQLRNLPYPTLSGGWMSFGDSLDAFIHVLNLILFGHVLFVESGKAGTGVLASSDLEVLVSGEISNGGHVGGDSHAGISALEGNWQEFVEVCEFLPGDLIFSELAVESPPVFWLNILSIEEVDIRGCKGNDSSFTSESEHFWINKLFPH